MVHFIQTLRKEDTATCYVLLNKQFRSLVSMLGAANKLTAQFMQEAIRKLPTVQIVYLSGFFAVERPDLTELIFSAFQRQTFFFGVSSS